MNEEINDIIEEMCNFVDNPTLGIKTKREKKLAGFMKSIIREFGARIEVAVAKMETTTSTCKDSLQVGDIAAMRDALESARDLILPHCNGSTEFAKACGETVNKIMNALAKPPRNCDLFGGDPKMLYTAWFDWTASPSGMNDDGTVKLTYGEWLLVRAKGGAHAAR